MVASCNKPVNTGSDADFISAERLCPFFHGTVGCNDRALTHSPVHQSIEIGSIFRMAAALCIAEIIDNQKVDSLQNIQPSGIAALRISCAQLLKQLACLFKKNAVASQGDGPFSLSNGQVCLS